MKIPIWIKSEYVTYIGISTFHSGRCWTSAAGTQQPPFFRPEGEAPPFMEGRPPFMYSAFP